MEINPVEIRAMVYMVTRRTGSPVHDEDLEQQVALHAIEAARRIDHITHPRALLMKIVYDTVREHWRRRQTWTCETIESIDERFVSQVPTFELNIDTERRLGILKRGLEALPNSKRAVLELFYIDEKSISEIAKLHGKSTSAVKMELLRSRQSLGRIVRSLANKKSR